MGGGGDVYGDGVVMVMMFMAMLVVFSVLTQW